MVVGVCVIVVGGEDVNTEKGQIRPPGEEREEKRNPSMPSPKVPKVPHLTVTLLALKIDTAFRDSGENLRHLERGHSSLHACGSNPSNTAIEDVHQIPHVAQGDTA